jgi:hypothetical protein
MTELIERTTALRQLPETRPPARGRTPWIGIPEKTPMKTWIRDLFRPSCTKSRTSSRSARFRVETLESRQVPTVTFEGGALLPHVEVQGLYLGSDWLANSSYYQQTGALEGFLKTIVNSSYFDALTNAGYGVGRGTYSQGIITPANLNKNVYLTDRAIQAYIEADVEGGALKAPDSNRLYVVFVEDNVAVMDSSGATSQNDFLGYHSAFAGIDASGRPVDIHYAVVTYPGGAVGNAAIPGLSTTNSITETTSHELAEAATDPNVNYKQEGWYDNQLNGEIGDIVNGQFVYLDGYAVQRISDRNDQPMTPAGATAFRPVSFVLQSNGNLFEQTSAGFTFLCGGIASVSSQGIDNSGRALVDVVTIQGQAYEYHDGSGWVYLASGVKDAEAGQGLSYVLLDNGSLFERRDVNGQVSYLAGGVVSIDAGTDHYGVNSVDLVLYTGAAYEISNTSGVHLLATGVKTISAGPLGVSEILLQNGYALDYREATNTFTVLAGNVAQITSGTDPSGSAMIDLLFSNGALYEYRTSTGWTYVANGVQSVSKGLDGVVDYILANGILYEHLAGGSFFLTGSVVKAV